jgi:hypothetical protein
MSKRLRDASEKEGPPMNRNSSSPGWAGLLTLAGVVGILVASIGTWQEMRKSQVALDDRLGKLETRLTQISAKIDQAGARAAAPAQRGPDPNRVYTVKTDGAPAQGPREAPVVIAEFSDFQ